ncbi:ComF family protein [Candidatus Kaiserbacteria bacterium]|nr:ComF family protein [Candidatus Kaiserbacteria bacterium]
MNFSTIINFIFPPSYDEKTLKACSDKKFLDYYQPQTINNVITLLPFTEPSVKAAIHLTKWHAKSRAIKLLGMILAKNLAGYEKETVIIPIPLSKKRFHERGYNQVDLIIKSALEQGLELDYQKNILSRCKNTKPQTSLKRSDRTQNIIGAFSCSSTKGQYLTGRSVIIIDDVMTTGSTLKEAEASLLPHHPSSITTLALAH